MEKVIRVLNGFEDAAAEDRKYYASLTPQQRLDLALEIGRLYREGLSESGERFERVYRVIELHGR